MKKAVFTIGEEPKAYIGYTSGRLWNGWATPYFELEEAKRVAEGFNECAEYSMQYDEVYDQFYVLDMVTKELEKWKGEDIHTEEGIKHLYGIGAYSWVWDEATDQDCKWLAEGIEDFIYEYDTYGYRDVGIDREELVEEIKEQLKELTTFQQVYELYHNEDLSSDERFDKLSKLLTV
jgi:hypothetical protein